MMSLKNLPIKDTSRLVHHGLRPRVLDFASQEPGTYPGWNTRVVHIPGEHQGRPRPGGDASPGSNRGRVARTTPTRWGRRHFHYGLGSVHPVFHRDRAIGVNNRRARHVPREQLHRNWTVLICMGKSVCTTTVSEKLQHLSNVPSSEVAMNRPEMACTNLCIERPPELFQVSLGQEVNLSEFGAWHIVCRTPRTVPIHELST